MDLTLTFMGADDAVASRHSQSQADTHLWDASHADPHNNLLVRWDWSAPGDGVMGELLVFWVSQRSALIWSSSVPVHPDEEPLVRAFLQPRLDYLTGLWAPLTPSGTALPE